MNYMTPNTLTQTGLVNSPKVPQIQAELDELGFAIDGMEKAIESLGARLSPIMIATGPQVEISDGNKDPRSLVMVAENIRIRSAKVKRLIALVQSYESRVEI